METTSWWHMQHPLLLPQLVEVKGIIIYLSVLFSPLVYFIVLWFSDIVVCCLYSQSNKNDGNICWPWSCSLPACMSELCHFYNSTMAKGRDRFRSVQCLRSLLETPRYAKANQPQDRCDKESPSGKDCQPGAEEESKSILKKICHYYWLCATAVRKHSSDVWGGIYYSRSLKETTYPSWQRGRRLVLHRQTTPTTIDDHLRRHPLPVIPSALTRHSLVPTHHPSAIRPTTLHPSTSSTVSPCRPSTTSNPPPQSPLSISVNRPPLAWNRPRHTTVSYNQPQRSKPVWASSKSLMTFSAVASPNSNRTTKTAAEPSSCSGKRRKTFVNCLKSRK